MIYKIVNIDEEVIKIVGKEVLSLQKGNGLIIDNQQYGVLNKYIDYDNKTVEIFVEEN